MQPAIEVLYSLSAVGVFRYTKKPQSLIPIDQGEMVICQMQQRSQNPGPENNKDGLEVIYFMKVNKF